MQKAMPECSNSSLTNYLANYFCLNVSFLLSLKKENPSFSSTHLYMNKYAFKAKI